MNSIACVSMWSVWLMVVLVAAVDAVDVDPKGYVVYCPCMGRFGNQADHFLGALAFIHGLNRTMVLPPWVEYEPGKARSTQIPFDRYFKVEPLHEYHRVITMETFMSELAPKVWPVGERTVLCYSGRNGGKSDSCNAKEGNPFGPFWDTFDIDFDHSEFYGPLHYDTRDASLRTAWNEKFPASKYPVLAFTGAPASFPVQEWNVKLQRHLVWSDHVESQAAGFIEESITGKPWLAIHMRNGMDWKGACNHVGEGDRHLFASASCLGYQLQNGRLTEEMCMPSEHTVLAQIKETVKHTKVKTIFVAADSNYMIAQIQQLFKGKVTVVKRSPPNPHVDLAILMKADYYIGNCVSTFSAFATRWRQIHDKPVAFWGFEPVNHDEL